MPPTFNYFIQRPNQDQTSFVLSIEAPPGMYWVTMTANNEKITKQVVINK